MTDGSYRILERSYNNGYTKYFLEKKTSTGWISVYAHVDLDEIRKARAQRELEEGFIDKVIE